MNAMWVPCAARMPEDGRPVLAFFRYAHHNTARVVRAQWVGKYTLEADDDHLDVDCCDYREEDDTYYVRPGWYETNEYEEVHWRVSENVTHWIPLPDPPTPEPAP